MPTRPLDRLLFAQGGLCFFCKQPLSAADATVEHLVASANGGHNADDNCVACCRSLNTLLGSMSLKEKIQVFLNQKGTFKCPNQKVAAKVPTPAPAKASPEAGVKTPKSREDRLALVVADLRKRGAARPRTVRTLGSTIGALFRKELSEAEVSALIDRLRAKGYITVVGGTKVSYALPPEHA